jgi:hypothetical protein
VNGGSCDLREKDLRPPDCLSRRRRAKDAPQKTVDGKYILDTTHWQVLNEHVLNPSQKNIDPALLVLHHPGSPLIKPDPFSFA